MGKSLNVGIAGLGTVGTGVFRLLQKNSSRISGSTGHAINIVAVSARNKNKDRGIDLSGVDWVDDPVSLAGRDDIDVVVELIGGEEGLAREIVQNTLKAGKPIVTANKALLAKHGLELAELSEKYNAPLFYEAAIAGGIPIVKSLREGLAGNDVCSVAGILNGTCNYILTEMERSGADFEDVLKDAQDKGYAEADPGFDIDGVDAAHKISLLSSIAFGTKLDFDSLTIEGIRNITSEDIQNALTLGYRIKLLSIAEKTDKGVFQKVSPALVPVDHSLAGVSSVLNAVYVTGDFVHSFFAVGPGAGQEPTASAVVSDIIDCACHNIRPVFGLPFSHLKTAEKLSASDLVKRFYLRLPVLDKAGVLADISRILKEHNISIETLIQIGRDPDQPVAIVMTTHEANAGEIFNVAKQIGALATSISDPCIIPIEDLD